MSVTVEQATALLIGPTFYWIVSGRNPAHLDARKLAEAFMDRAPFARVTVQILSRVQGAGALSLCGPPSLGGVS